MDIVSTWSAWFSHGYIDSLVRALVLLARPNPAESTDRWSLGGVSPEHMRREVNSALREELP